MACKMRHVLKRTRYGVNVVSARLFESVENAKGPRARASAFDRVGSDPIADLIPERTRNAFILGLTY